MNASKCLDLFAATFQLNWQQKDYKVTWYMLSLQVDCISTSKHEKIFGNVAVIGHDELSSIWIMTNGKRQGEFKCQASHLLLYHCLLTTPSKKKVIVLWNINTSTSTRLTPNFNFWNGQTIISFFCSGQRKRN